MLPKFSLLFKPPGNELAKSDLEAASAIAISKQQKMRVLFEKTNLAMFNKEYEEAEAYISIVIEHMQNSKTAWLKRAEMYANCNNCSMPVPNCFSDGLT